MTSVIEQEHFLMFGRMRDWAGVGAVFAGLALGVSAAPGYLPAVGPVPLRFRLAAQPDTHLLLMPLPPPDLPPPAPSIPSAPPAGTNTEAQKTPTATAPSSAAALSASSGPAEPGASPAGPGLMVSPQMLMQYFSRPTNGAAAGVMAPVNFAPPAAPPQSSTATYSTDPK